MTDSESKIDLLVKFAGIFGRKWAFLVGRDTTGLMLLIEKLTPPDGRVILPAMACMTRLASVLETGRTPVIVDVDSNLGMDPERLAEVATEGDLVVPLHIFGIPFRVDEIEKICASKGCTLVEDGSQAIGGKVRKKPVGSIGKASILSFSDEKTLPTHGGGVVLTDDNRLAEYLLSAVAELPERPPDFRERKKKLDDDSYYEFKKARAGDTKAAAAWYEIYREVGSVYKFAIRPEEESEIFGAVESMESIVKKNREMVYMFMKYVNNPEITVLQYPIGAAPYRFTFILPEELSGKHTQQLTSHLRTFGLSVANLYIPLQWLAPDKVVTRGCPNAEKAGIRILNLWIGEKTFKTQAKSVGSVLNSIRRQSVT